MKQVAEIIYVVPEERESFMNAVLHPSQETQKLLWLCGVRNQGYYSINDLIIEVFMYEGNHFYEDMAKLSAYLEKQGMLIEKRRKDVPASEQKTTSWWAPLKKYGLLLPESPFREEDEGESFEERYRGMTSGEMQDSGVERDFSYDEDDWSESIHI